MNSPLPVEQLRNIWLKISAINEQINALNNELLLLKEYVNTSISEIDLGNYLTKDLLFREGDKNIEIDKGATFTANNLNKSSIYLGGKYQGAALNNDKANIIIGYGAYTNYPQSTVIGTQSYTGGSQSVSIGNTAYTTGDYAISLGSTSTAFLKGVAAGYMGRATGEASTALGFYAETTGSMAVGVGYKTKATGDSSLAIGPVSEATSSSSVAVGAYAQVKGTDSIAIGSDSEAGGQNSVAIGHSATTSFKNSIAIGYNVATTASNTISIGDSTITRAQFGNLVLTWTSTSLRISYGTNSVTLALSPP
jgi:autotransporter adhesin